MLSPSVRPSAASALMGSSPMSSTMTSSARSNRGEGFGDGDVDTVAAHQGAEVLDREPNDGAASFHGGVAWGFAQMLLWPSVARVCLWIGASRSAPSTVRAPASFDRSYGWLRRSSLWFVRADGEASGEIALQAAFDLAWGASLRRCAVGSRDQHGRVQGPVELAVPAAVEPVADGLAG